MRSAAGASKCTRSLPMGPETTCIGPAAAVRQALDIYREQDCDGIIGLGGVSRKSPFVMQTLANVLNRSIRISATDQTCALGAAMFGATAAGLFPQVDQAMRAMGQGFDATYEPDPEAVPHYNQLYQQYQQLGAFVGG